MGSSTNRWSREEIEETFQRHQQLVVEIGKSWDWARYGELFTEDATYGWNLGPAGEFMAVGRDQIRDVGRADTVAVVLPMAELIYMTSQRANARFDPQTLTLLTRNRVFRPLGIVPVIPTPFSETQEIDAEALAETIAEENRP